MNITTNSCHRIPFFVAIAAAAGIATLGAAHAQWTSRAGPQPVVRSLNVFPNNPTAGTTTLLATTLTSGVFTATDSGTGPANWTARNNGLPTLRLFAHRALSTTSIIVATDGFGVYSTTDGGNNWSALNGSGGSALGCRNARAVAIPGSVTTTIYAGTACTSSSGVWRSTDSGATWSRLGVGVIPADAVVGSFQVTGDGTLIFAATTRHGLFRSTDSGANWTQVNTGLPGAEPNVFNVNFAGTGTSTLLAYVFGEGIYKSTDTGSSWTLSSTGLPANAVAVGGFSRDGASNTTFYLGLDGQGIFRSTDSGANWSIWGNTGSLTARYFRSVNNDSSAAGKYYFATLEGVRKTLDNAFSISEIDGASTGAIWSITHDWSNPIAAFVLASTPSKILNVYGSYNDDSNFMELENGLTGNTIGGSIRQDPADAAKLYVVTANRGVLRSTNGGALWTPINTGLPAMHGQGNFLAIDQANPQFLYLALIGAGVYKSTNGGDTWAAANNGLTTDDSKRVRSVSISGGTGSTVYIATADGAYKSVDGGANWTLIYSANDGAGMPLGVQAVRANPANTNEVYMANFHRNPDGSLVASSGVWKSTNGGTNWSQVLSGKRVSTIVLEPDGTVYAGLDEDIGQPALLRSTDGGSTWPAYSGGLNGSRFRTAGFDSRNQKLRSLSLDTGFHTRALPPFARADTSGDGKSDVVLKGPNGEVVVWLMDGAAIANSTLLLGASTYIVSHVADVNGDGKADLMLRGPAGEIVLWEMDGAVVTASTLLLGPGTGYQIVRGGDFNGDGRMDALLRHSDGTLVVWLMNGPTVTASAVLLGAGSTAQPDIVADFDGDGKSDILLQDAGGALTLWLMNGIAVASSQGLLGGGTGYVPSDAADFNGDGKADVLLTGPGGEIVMWLMNGTTISSSTLLLGSGTGYTITLAPELDGDGRADIVLKGPTGQIVVWLMNGASITSSTLLYGGGPWTVTGTGIFDGDGKQDLLLRGPNGEIVVWLMNGATITNATLLVGATTWAVSP